MADLSISLLKTSTAVFHSPSGLIALCFLECSFLSQWYNVSLIYLMSTLSHIHVSSGRLREIAE